MEDLCTIHLDHAKVGIFVLLAVAHGGRRLWQEDEVAVVVWGGLTDSLLEAPRRPLGSGMDGTERVGGTSREGDTAPPSRTPRNKSRTVLNKDIRNAKFFFNVVSIVG